MALSPVFNQDCQLPDHASRKGKAISVPVCRVRVIGKSKPDQQNVGTEAELQAVHSPPTPNNRSYLQKCQQNSGSRLAKIRPVPPLRPIPTCPPVASLLCVPLVQRVPRVPSARTPTGGGGTMPRPESESPWSSPRGRSAGCRDRPFARRSD